MRAEEADVSPLRDGARGDDEWIRGSMILRKNGAGLISGTILPSPKRNAQHETRSDNRITDELSATSQEYLLATYTSSAQLNDH